MAAKKMAAVKKRETPQKRIERERIEREKRVARNRSEWLKRLKVEVPYLRNLLLTFYEPSALAEAARHPGASPAA